MKEFPQPQIDSTQRYFETQGFLVETKQLGDLTVSYFVLPQALNPDLQDFALRMTRTDVQTHEVSGIFGVSDSVPQELRPYWAAHEIIEFLQIGISEKSRCVEAEERVIGLINLDFKNEYIERRTVFFDNLFNFFRNCLANGSEDYTKDDLEEAEKTLSYLKGIRVGE